MTGRLGLALLALACGCATLRTPAPPAPELPRVLALHAEGTSGAECPGPTP